METEADPSSFSQRPQSLALHVLTKTGKASYLGWSGMSSSVGGAGGGKEWLEVDPGVGEGFGWKDGMEVSRLLLSFSHLVLTLRRFCFKVEISIIHSLTPAKSISVAPLTPEDWEIIVRSDLALPLPPFRSFVADLCVFLSLSVHARQLPRTKLALPRSSMLAQPNLGGLGEGEESGEDESW